MNMEQIPVQLLQVKLTLEATFSRLWPSLFSASAYSPVSSRLPIAFNNALPCKYIKFSGYISLLQYINVKRMTKTLDIPVETP